MKEKSQSQKTTFFVNEEMERGTEKLLQEKADEAAGLICHCLWPQFFDEKGQEIKTDSTTTVDKEGNTMSTETNTGCKEKFVLRISTPDGGEDVLTPEGGFIPAEKTYMYNGKRYVRKTEYVKQLAVVKRHTTKDGILLPGEFIIGFIDPNSQDWRSQILDLYKEDLKRLKDLHKNKTNK